MTRQTRTLEKVGIFQADAFPDDTVQDGHDIQVFPGRNIAEALIPILRQAGCTDIGEPLHRDEHGWEMLFRSDGKRFFLQVSRIEPETILHFDKNYAFEGLFHRGPSRLSVLLEKVRPLIAADARFAGLTWFRQEEGYPPEWRTRLDELARAEVVEDA